MNQEPIKKQGFFKKIGVGDPLCSIYKNREEQEKIISSCIQHGIETGKKCIIGCNNQRKTEIAETLNDELDVSKLIKKEQLTFYDPEELYLTNGQFKPDYVISHLKKLEKRAKEQGFQGVQGTAEMTETFSKKIEIDKFFEFEAKLNYFVENGDSFLLCQFNEKKFSPKFLLDVIHSHPRILLYGSLYENPYYIPPDQFLARSAGNITAGLYKSVINDIRHRSQIVENENVARKRMNQLSSLLLILQEINRITTEDTELAPMFQKSVDVLVESGEYTDVSIFLYNEKEDCRMIAHGSKHDLRDEEQMFNQSSEFPCVKEIPQKHQVEPVQYSENQCAECRLCHHSSSYSHQALVLPMIHNEKLIGILHICYEPTRTIDDQEKKLLKNVANELAFARENVRIQKAIKKSEEKFRTVVENANSCIYVRDEEGRLTYVNPRAVEMLGYSKDEFLGEKIWQFFHPQDRKNPKQQKKIKKVQQGELVESVVRLKTKSGETLHLKTRAVPIKEKGELKQVIGIAMDITERLTYESKLQQYKQAIERSNDLMYAINKEYRYIFANETYLQYHDVSRDDLIGLHIKNFLGKKVFQQEESYYKRVLKGERVEFEESYTYPKKGKRKLLVSLYPLRDEGEIRGIVHTAKDITERKKIQNKVEALHYWVKKLNTVSTKEELLQYALDAIEDTLEFDKAMIFLKEREFLRLQTYRGFESLPEKFLQQSLEGPSLSVKAAKRKKSILSNDLVSNSRVFSPYPTVKAGLAVPIVRNREVLGVLTVGSEQIDRFEEHDQRLLELLASHIAVALNELKEKQKRISLQELENLRSEFVEMAAHEINTPLTPIKTNLEMLEQEYFGELTPKQEETVKKSLRNLDRLSKLVSDFRRVTMIRSSKKQPSKHRCFLADIIEKVLDKDREVLKKKDILVIKDVQKSLTCKCDESRIIQVIHNLVENAIDYTEDKIWIKAWEEEKSILVSVRDNGPGIPLETQEQIFDPFYRVEQERTRVDREFGGYGLGLYICKQIMEAHNGKIWLDSKPGKGATFTIALPKR